MSYVLPLQNLISLESSIDVKYAALSAQFGDGYEQVAPLGINRKSKVWNIIYRNMNAANTQTILNFLDSVEGYQTFFATPIGEIEQKWRLIPDSVQIQHYAEDQITHEPWKHITFKVRSAV
ncbi:phage tail protein [Zoogloea sp.]|uniref:phage tail protein n=1 Tax=Zoogloea sp. TaxID=49181 RepID=UPI001416BCE5|nr:MAG: phage tail protein [Zoogloea sp.]